MGAAAGLFSQSITAGQSLSPFDSTTGTSGSSGAGSSSSSSDTASATISANDFLSLLVTEMQNQDPTSETDPNEYIDQLVDVNSLEQLININQTLTGAFDPSTTGATGDAATAQAAPATGAGAVNGGQSASGASALTARPAASAEALSAPAASQSVPTQISAAPPAATARRAPGNLSVPAANPAAERVAHSLSGHGLDGRGHPRAKPLGGKLSRFEQTALNNRP
jgi:flagellar basal-body rod modification protein FlgD